MTETPLHIQVREAAGAGFGGIWIRSCEHEDAMKQVAEACKPHGWNILMWDAEYGTREPSPDGPQPADDANGDANPMTALKVLRDRRPVGAAKEGLHRVLLVMRQPHFFMFTPEGRVMNAKMLQMLQHVIEQGEDDLIHVVVLAHDNASLPAELEKHFFMVDHAMPSPDELWDLITEITEPEDLPDDEKGKELLLDAASGLTRMEAGGAIGLALTRLQDGQKLDATSLWELKANTLRKSGLLEMYSGNDTFDTLGGLNHVKEFCLKTFNSPNRGRHVQANGIGLIGVPGTGKSAFAKALGNEVGLPTITLDFGALMGSLVGQTEAQARRAFRTIDAMAPCIVFVDEIEKGLAGTGGGGENDSGVGKRLLGTTLTWLNDHETDVFFIFTANNIQTLLNHAPEFTRAERFDALFFMDMPTKEQRDAIWDIYIEHYKKHGLSDEQAKKRPNDDSYTGAEIKACCRLATLLNIKLTEAAKNVVPVSLTSAERITELREWAHHRCLSADHKGMFDKDKKFKMMTAEEITERPRRKITRRA